MSIHFASWDCETYSEAGYVWNPAGGTGKKPLGRWEAPPGARQAGISACGTAAYAMHPTTDLLTLTYWLPAWWPGGGVYRRWKPGEPLPVDLFAYLAAGWPIESHKAMFERLIWEHVLVKRYGFPPLNPYQQRCSMATARVDQYPGKLADLSAVLDLRTKKNADGKRLIAKFSVPHNPTQKDKRLRIRPEDDPADFENMRAYCDGDVATEQEGSGLLTPMSEDELFFWWIDQEINYRGLGIDREGVRACIVILQQVLDVYGAEFRQLTGGLNPSQLQAFQGWLSAHGVHLDNMQEATIDAAVERLPPHPPGGIWPPRRALEIRQLTGSASVKKLFAMEAQACPDDRLRDLLQHHATRTGRPAGEGPQPLNLPKAGPKLATCEACARPFKPSHPVCPWCGGAPKPGKPKWAAEMVDHVLEIIRTGSLAVVEWFFGDALLCISGCIRGLFVAAPGFELIASDYSAIEAVVTAMLADEKWRIEAFRKKEPIYLVGASKITGRSVEEYLAYKETNGDHHPDRQYVGKVSELALGFGGWINAWRQMEEQQKKDNPSFVSPYTDDDIKRLILAWRAASPNIVEFWGGQHRGRPWDRDRRQEYFGIEGHAVLALLYPGQVFTFRGIRFFTRILPTGKQALIVRLLSGRELTYHEPCLVPSPKDPSEYSIIYWTWNTNPNYGPQGWVAMSTYGGRLTENIVQATAHDLMRFAIVNLRAAGYPCVLHVYDEIVCEIPIGTGSLEEFERIMRLVPAWAAGWPVDASGGWRGRRYRKG